METTATVGIESPRDRDDTPDPLIGRALQHFRVLDKIGSGGMGSVYRAHDRSLDRIVALKVIAKEKAADPVLIERFTREARAQAKVSHTNVVPIYYIGEQDGLHFMAMELADGEALDQPMKRGERVAWPEALEHVISAAKALRKAHEHNLVHRDIKPSNLLRTADGVVKVADFGLAKSTDPGTSQLDLTQEGVVLGSPYYMSPEQGHGEATDHRSDIYSLGATFYHLLAAEPPFTAKTAMGVITKHVTSPIPSVTREEPGIPGTLDGILKKMMAKEQGERYQSYDELLGALRDARPRPVTTGGFWVRGMANSVDLILFAILHGIVTPFVWLLWPIYLAAGWWWKGKTLGKAIFKLRVRTADDSAPSLPRCLLRVVCQHWGVIAILGVLALQLVLLRASNIELDGPLPELIRTAPVKVLFGAAYMLLTALFLGSLAWVGFTRHKLALHDQWSKTMVVYHLPQVVPAVVPAKSGRPSAGPIDSTTSEQSS